MLPFAHMTGTLAKAQALWDWCLVSDRLKQFPPALKAAGELMLSLARRSVGGALLACHHLTTGGAPGVRYSTVIRPTPAKVRSLQNSSPTTQVLTRRLQLQLQPQDSSGTTSSSGGDSGGESASAAAEGSTAEAVAVVASLATGMWFALDHACCVWTNGGGVAHGMCIFAADASSPMVHKFSFKARARVP